MVSLRFPLLAAFPYAALRGEPHGERIVYQP